jgi:hypothetical protein
VGVFVSVGVSVIAGVFVGAVVWVAVGGTVGVFVGAAVGSGCVAVAACAVGLAVSVNGGDSEAVSLQADAKTRMIVNNRFKRSTQ